MARQICRAPTRMVSEAVGAGGTERMRWRMRTTPMKCFRQRTTRASTSPRRWPRLVCFPPAEGLQAAVEGEGVAGAEGATDCSPSPPRMRTRRRWRGRSRRNPPRARCFSPTKKVPTRKFPFPRRRPFPKFPNGTPWRRRPEPRRLRKNEFSRWRLKRHERKKRLVVKSRGWMRCDVKKRGRRCGGRRRFWKRNGWRRFRKRERNTRARERPSRPRFRNRRNRLFNHHPRTTKQSRKKTPVDANPEVCSAGPESWSVSRRNGSADASGF
mmetsp:Transcript_13224/g.43814  ORF Transcript_13224/g.43814 Transcript_13224/m.43814 type:complete len:269 (+) Transcript_13224:568-1374(+)